MSPNIQNENNSQGNQELFYSSNIPPRDDYTQENETPKMSSETAIEIFGEAARQPVCDNLKLYCQQWGTKTREISEIERIIQTLPIIKNQISLRVLYETKVPRLRQDLHQIERHIRRLQRCLELLEKKKIFTSPADLPGHVDVNQLKDRVDIADVVSQWVELRQSGRTMKGKCPLHDDRSPSFVVYPDTQSWWCFACQEGGDAIEFIQKIRNCGFREAVAELQRL